MTDYQGHCFCGAIQFKTRGEPLFTQYCHCQKCRDVAALSKRDSDKVGYGFTAAYLTDHFIITQGEGEQEVIVKNNADLHLCRHCHSLIYGISRDPALQGGIGINVNNFEFADELPDTFKPDKHIWYENRVVNFDDALPKYRDAPEEQFGTGMLYE